MACLALLLVSYAGLGMRLPSCRMGVWPHKTRAWTLYLTRMVVPSSLCCHGDHQMKNTPCISPSCAVVSLQPYCDQIDQVEASVSTLEQTAYSLDAYCKRLGESCTVL